MGTAIRTDKPQDKLTRREMLRLSAAGMAALQGKLFAPVVRHAAAVSSPATAESQLLSTSLKTWCDGLIARCGTATAAQYELRDAVGEGLREASARVAGKAIPQ